MAITDVEYDGVLLSDFSCRVCSFSGKGIETNQFSQLNVNTVLQRSNDIYMISDVAYSAPLSSSFDICKINCNNDDSRSFSIEEIIEIRKWLDKKDYKILKFVNEKYKSLFCYAIFTSINEYKLGNDTIGFNVSYTTSRPYMLEEFNKNIDLNIEACNLTIDSDEYNYLDPNVFKIDVRQNGDLIIENDNDSSNRIVVNGCINGECLIFDSVHKTIVSNIRQNILSYSNYNFPRLLNNENVLRSSLPCSVHIELEIPRKVGVLL